MGLRDLLRRFKPKSVQAGYGDDRDRDVDNIDAMASAAASQRTFLAGQGGAALFPPDYVKDDDGRPRH